LTFDENSGFLSIENGNSVPLNSLSGGSVTYEEMEDLITELKELIQYYGEMNMIAIGKYHDDGYKYLLEKGATVADLLDAGATLKELYEGGIFVGTLEQNGVNAADLEAAGLIGTVTDVDGNQYKWIKVGDKRWMAENLRTTKLRDGTDIPLVTDNSAWGAMATPAYSWYNNDEPTYGNTYGALYNWYTVETGKLCPVFWRVPGNDEWNALLAPFGFSSAGGALKEVGTVHWESPNEGATNESGFSALAGGGRGSSGLFSSLGYNANFWSTDVEDEFGMDMRWHYYLYHDNSLHGAHYTYPETGFSIRCVRD
jgi:uncharacterized protein (TIGR02145 family)